MSGVSSVKDNTSLGVPVLSSQLGLFKKLQAIDNFSTHRIMTSSSGYVVIYIHNEYIIVNHRDT